MERTSHHCAWYFCFELVGSGEERWRRLWAECGASTPTWSPNVTAEIANGSSPTARPSSSVLFRLAVLYYKGKQLTKTLVDKKVRLVITGEGHEFLLTWWEQHC